MHSILQSQSTGPVLVENIGSKNVPKHTTDHILRIEGSEWLCRASYHVSSIELSFHRRIIVIEKILGARSNEQDGGRRKAMMGFRVRVPLLFLRWNHL
jgi:hypothetical protein